MAESIGNLYSTEVPALSDTADIQEALRLYHYGAPSGSGVGQYPITNTDPSNLVIPSVAYHLYNLQEQINDFDAGLSLDSYTQKGVLISASGPANPLAITPAANGQVLTTNSATATGLEWQVPAVTLTNTVTLSNKTLSNSSISSAGIKFNGASGNAFTITMLTVTPTANQVITLPNATTTLVGIDTVQTLTNKSIDAGQITGILDVDNGGTGASTPANARANIEIFNRQTTVGAGDDRESYSGKIYVADPAVVGASGANLDGVATGDLWFW